MSLLVIALWVILPTLALLKLGCVDESQRANVSTSTQQRTGREGVHLD